MEKVPVPFFIQDVGIPQFPHERRRRELLDLLRMWNARPKVGFVTVAGHQRLPAFRGKHQDYEIPLGCLEEPWGLVIAALVEADPDVAEELVRRIAVLTIVVRGAFGEFGAVLGFDEDRGRRVLPGDLHVYFRRAFVPLNEFPGEGWLANPGLDPEVAVDLWLEPPGTKSTVQEFVQPVSRVDQLQRLHDLPGHDVLTRRPNQKRTADGALLRLGAERAALGVEFDKH